MPDNRTEDQEVKQYRTPPFSKEAEDGVLGALLIDNNTFDLIGGKLDSEDFYDFGNRLIFDTIKRLLSQGKPADVLTVHDALREAGHETETGGLEYLNRMADYSPGAANVLRYAEIIRDRSIRRRLITTGNDIINDSMNPGAREAKDLLDEAQSKVLKISEDLSRSSSGFQKIDQVLAEYTDHIKELSEIDNPSNVSGISTGFPDLDRMTSGMHEGQLIIVAGRPAMGKTAFALNIALHVGAHQGLPIGIFSLEMSSQEVTGRLLSAKGEIPQGELKTGHLENWRGFYDAAEELEKAPIFIDDTPGISILSLRSRARQLLSRVGGKLGLIVVDYLQLMTGEKAGRGTEANRAQEIAEISRGLKGLARELKVPVIALSQLKREVDSRPNKRPLMSDLRESGSIEQDADIILFLYREAAYRQSSENAEGEEDGMPPVDPNAPTDAEVIIAKQRSGPTGVVNLLFQGTYTRFVSRTTHSQMNAGY